MLLLGVAAAPDRGMLSTHTHKRNKENGNNGRGLLRLRYATRLYYTVCLQQIIVNHETNVKKRTTNHRYSQSFYSRSLLITFSILLLQLYCDQHQSRPQPTGEQCQHQAGSLRWTGRGKAKGT